MGRLEVTFSPNPSCLPIECPSFSSLGCAPMNKSVSNNETWGPIVNSYVIKIGCKYQRMNFTLPPCSRIQNHIWGGDGLPKISIFPWIMAHGRLVIVENLKKHGIQELSTVCFVYFKRQKLNHIPLLIVLFPNIHGSSHLQKLGIEQFSIVLGTKCSPPSQKKYTGIFLNKPILKRAQQEVPKFAYWKIQPTRNRAIFQQDRHISQSYYYQSLWPSD